MRLAHFLFAAIFAAVSISFVHAKDLVVTQELPDVVADDQATELAIDLRQHFGLSAVTGQVVQLDTRYGPINIELFQTQAPLTSANFLKYVDDGSYDNVMFHRSVPGFVVQAGGFKAANPPTAIASKGTVVNEFNLPNVRGTLAMAKLGNDPNSATNQWFINLAANGGEPSNLDTQNGGFTVFARILGTGMAVADEIEDQPFYNFSNAWGGAFGSVPLDEVETTSLVADMITVKTAKRIAIYPQTNTSPSVLSFAAASSNESVVKATIEGSELHLEYGSNRADPATITITATDSNNNQKSSAFILSYTLTSLNPSDVVKDAADTTYEISVSANGPWQVGDSTDWIAVSPSAGTGDATVAITLQPNPELGPRNGEVAIGNATHSVSQLGRTIANSDLTFEDWINLHFSADEIDAMLPNPWDADSDEDGLSNGVEQALGLDPTLANENPFRLKGSLDSGAPALQVTPFNADLLIELQSSDDLSVDGWSDPFEAEGSIVGDAFVVPFALEPAAARFYRIFRVALRPTLE